MSTVTVTDISPGGYVPPEEVGSYMTIALVAHDTKKELMIQFCIAYCGILSRYNLVATGATGKTVSEATGLEIVKFLFNY